MAISWGTKIFFLYTGFILLIGTLVWKSTQSKVELVSEDYYEQEVGFQKRLDAQSATAALSQKPVVSVTEKSLLIFFPQEFSGKEILAEVKLYHRANSALDKLFSGLSANHGTLEISREKLPLTRYTMQIAWQCDGKSYYQEFPINLSLQ